jgi:arabinosyltransferase C
VAKPAEGTPEFHRREVLRFARIFGLATVLVALIPFVIGLANTPAGSRYLGYQFALDDYMVYAAWMRQAMDGRLLFENLFAIDPQPGLTFHAYFLVLGWVARLIGIAAAETLARALFSYLFVVLLARLVLRMPVATFTAKLAIAFATLGGGVGFILWQNFGVAWDAPPSPVVNTLTLGQLPTDVWQPEGFVFPSMLTNSLFMVSLCLVLVVFGAVLDARERSRAAWPGFFGLAALMNIHSYDVLIVTLVLVAFLGACAAARLVTTPWLIRGLIMGLGAVPPAAWFLHVLANDPVFQARAATLTFSPGFRSVLLGYLPLLILGLWGLGRAVPSGRSRQAVLWAMAALGTILVLAWFAEPMTDRYWLGAPAWAGLFTLSILGAVALRREDPTWNLLAAWALVGLVALYFPALFQRKLAMGLAIPWGILAAIGLAEGLTRLDRSGRNLAATLAILVLAGSSARWLQREALYIRANVSRTTTHAPYLSADATRVIAEVVSRRRGRTVVLAMPGLPMKTGVDAFAAPYLPDLNPILSGLAGVTTYAGHWSETPDYLSRRRNAERFFLRGAATDSQRQDFLTATGVRFVVAPHPEAFREIPLDDLSKIGRVIYEGAQFRLIEVTP